MRTDLFGRNQSAQGIVWGCALVLIAASLEPFALSRAGVMPDRLFYYIFFPFIFLWVVVNAKARVSDLPLAILYLQIAFLVCLAVYRQSYSDFLTAGTLASVAVVYLALSNGLIKLESFVHAYVLFIIAVLALAGTSMLLALSGSIEPVLVFERSDTESVYLFGLTLTSEFYRWGTGYFIRPGGIFIESGQLGMHATLAILANAVVVRNRSYERLLMLLGLFTTSLGFYVSTALFMLLWRRKADLIFASIVLLGALIIAGGVEALEQGTILVRTVGRLFTVFGTEAGGNRWASMWTGLELLDKAGLWGGLREADWLLAGDADATIVGPLLRYGVLGGIILYLHVILLGAVGTRAIWRLKPREPENVLFKVFVILALNLYHRPFVVHFLYYLILLAMLMHAEHRFPDRFQHNPRQRVLGVP